MDEVLKKMKFLRHAALNLEIQLSRLPKNEDSNGAMEAAKDIKQGIDELKNILQEVDKHVN